MKKSRNNQNRKILGIAIGESSLLLAEVIGGERPSVSNVAEYTYPADLGPEKLPEMTPDLVTLLREKGFTSRSAVVGLPAKWLVVKSKEIPTTDRSTQLSMLRLQADAEFSSELKDLSYDVAGTLGSNSTTGEAGAGNTTVLLAATSGKFVLSVQALCAAIGVELLGITASALALGDESRRTSSGDTLVLSIGPAGTELTARRGGATTALRRIASAAGARPSIGELRRTLSSLAATDRGHNLTLWEAPYGPATHAPDDTRADLDWSLLSQQLGLQIRPGTLATLGATGPASLNGDTGRFAPAIALAVAGLAHRLPVDFLHSRLAPPKTSPVPQWTLWAGLAGLAVLCVSLWGFHDLGKRKQALADANAQIALEKDRVELASAFVGRVSFARDWHGGNPRYLDCLRALTRDMPDDPNTYATSLTLRETPKPLNGAVPTPGVTPKAPGPRTISGQLYGRAGDQKSGQAVLDRLRHDSQFTEVKSGGTQDAGRGHDVSFSITFVFLPTTPTP